MKQIHERKMRILAGLAGAGRVLDVGCSAMTNPFLTDAVGVDIIPPPVTPPNYREIRLCNLNTDPLPLSDASFDAVIAGDLIEHLENPSHFLREANRVLVPGGRLVLCTPQANDWWVTLHNWFFRRWIHDPDPGEHLQNWTILDMTRLLVKSGFRVGKVEGLYFQTPFAPIRIRMRRFPQFAWQAIYVATRVGPPDRSVLVKDGAARKPFEPERAPEAHPQAEKIRCSVPVLTLNNRESLERLLPVLIAAFEDVFIIDGNSTDGTPEYARSLGVRVERQSDDPTPNLRVTHFARAREHSWSLAKFDWIYWIDSDEIPTPELIDAVRRVVRENHPAEIHQFVRMARLPDGRLVRHAFFYPEYIPRLFHRASGVSLVDRPVHERFVVPESVRVVRHAETFVAPWPDPSAFWKKHLGYLELDRLKPSPRWSVLIRWVIGYNVRSLVGQFLRAARCTVAGALTRETALPWAYNRLFLRYRLIAIRNGIRGWRAARAEARKGSVGETGIRAFLKRNAVFFACAAIVGGISIAPHVLHVLAVGSAYAGMPYMPLDDEAFYVARIREILDGHWAIGSHYYFEYKNFPTPYPPVGEFVFYALPVLLFRIPFMPFFVASKFLFPAALFFLIAVFTRQLAEGGERPSRNAVLTAVAAGALATVGYDALYAGSVTHLLQGPLGSTSNVWTRPVNPITGGFFLFSILLLMASLIRTHRRTVVAAIGALVGASASYFFSWGIALAVLAVAALAYALKGERRIRNDLACAFLIGIAASAIVLQSTIRSIFAQGSGGVSASRIGAIYSHAPIWNLAVIGGIALFAVCTGFLWHRDRAAGFRRRPEDWWMVSASLLLGSLLAFTEQVVTGMTVWPAHFVQYAKPLSVIAVLAAGYHAVGRKMPRAWAAAMAALIVFTGVVGAQTLTDGPDDVPLFREAQGDAPLYAWLNAHAPKDCVVFVKEKGYRIKESLPAFTSCNVYAGPRVSAGIPEERIRFNFFAVLRSEGVTPQTFGTYLRLHPDFVKGNFYADMEKLLTPNVDAGWIEARIRELEPDYREFYGRDFASALSTYRLDYIFVEGATPATADIGLPYARMIGTVGAGALFEPL